MELDELKTLWQRIDRNLEQRNGMELQRLRATKARSLRATLRPLFAGQIIQIAAGAILLFIVAAFWSTSPGSLPLILSGITVHVYAIVIAAVGARTVVLLRKIDHAAAVITIQKQLAELRRFYVRSGMLVGLVWWLLWIPCLAVLFRFAGVDLYQNVSRPWLLSSALFGVAGLIATYMFHRWSSRPGRTRTATFIHEATTGASLLQAQHVLDDIAQFEREHSK
jgi:hypothetical protein